MKYREPKILLEVRKIKAQLQEKMEREGTDAFFERINRRAGKSIIRIKPKSTKAGR